MKDKTYIIHTTHSNLLVKQGDRVAYFTQLRHHLRPSDLDEWKYAVAYWDKQVIETDETFNFTR